MPVHGSMHGSWCRERVVSGLEERGVPVLAVDLPGREANSDRPRGRSEDVAVVLEAVDRLVREPVGHGGDSQGAPPVVAPWERIPTTYVVCADDRGVPAHVQWSRAPRAQTVVEWDTEHSPFLSRAGLVVDLLAPVAGEVDATSAPTD